MKTLIPILVFLFFLPSISKSQNKSIEAFGGGYVYHIYWDKGKHYKPLNRGLIREIVGLRYRTEKKYYKTVSVFTLKNCVQHRRYGALFSIGKNYKINKTFSLDVGLIAGGYNENKEDWKGYGMFAYDIGGILPMAGVELNLKANITKELFFTVNTLTTAIFHANVGFGCKF